MKEITYPEGMLLFEIIRNSSDRNLNPIQTDMNIYL